MRCLKLKSVAGLHHRRAKHVNALDCAKGLRRGCITNRKWEKKMCEWLNLGFQSWQSETFQTGLFQQKLVHISNALNLDGDSAECYESAPLMQQSVVRTYSVRAQAHNNSQFMSGSWINKISQHVTYLHRINISSSQVNITWMCGNMFYMWPQYSGGREPLLFIEALLLVNWISKERSMMETPAVFLWVLSDEEFVNLVFGPLCLSLFNMSVVTAEPKESYFE